MTHKTFDTKRHVSKRSCRCHDFCSSRSQKLYVFVESPYIGDIVYENCTTYTNCTCDCKSDQSNRYLELSLQIGALATALINVPSQIIILCVVRICCKLKTDEETQN